MTGLFRTLMDGWFSEGSVATNAAFWGFYSLREAILSFTAFPDC